MFLLSNGCGYCFGESIKESFDDPWCWPVRKDKSCNDCCDEQNRKDRSDFSPESFHYEIRLFDGAGVGVGAALPVVSSPTDLNTSVPLMTNDDTRIKIANPAAMSGTHIAVPSRSVPATNPPINGLIVNGFFAATLPT